MPETTVAIAAKGVSKTYPNGVRAVRGLDFIVDTGEIRALVGENGAGKSTLMKMLYGLEQPTTGSIEVHGLPMVLAGPSAAIAQGIGMVHQNLMLVPSLTIAENIVLGIEPGSRLRVKASAANEATAALSEEAGLKVDPRARVSDVSVGMRQRAEILKALHRGARILILDEPTAVLTPQETDDLFVAVRRLREGGMTVLFISHKLKEVREISDRVSVMRAGAMIGTVDTKDATPASLATMMVGREMSLEIPKPPATPGEVVLQVRGLGYRPKGPGEALAGISFDVRAGEIVGLAGIEGNGQTELAEILAGLRKPTEGAVQLDGSSLADLSVAGHRERGVSYIPEDRLHNGAALDQSIADNVVVDRFSKPPIGTGGRLRPGKIADLAEDLIREYSIRAPDPAVSVGSLSGGNMQKVIVAREISSKPKLLVSSQLTRGVDIGAMQFMYARVIDARDAGAAVFLVSADLTELLGLADRLLVIKDGEIVGRFDSTKGLTEEEVGLYMLGVHHHEPAVLSDGLVGG